MTAFFPILQEEILGARQLLLALYFTSQGFENFKQKERNRARERERERKRKKEKEREIERKRKRKRD